MDAASLVDLAHQVAKEQGISFERCRAPAADEIADVPDGFAFRVPSEVMLAWSRCSEKTVLWRHLADAEIHTGFQRLSRIRPVRARYRDLGATASELWLYGARDFDPEIPRARIVDASGTSFEHEWFVAVKSREYTALVAARELARGEARTFARREYDGIVTRHPATVEQVIETLRDWVEQHQLG